ncbi:MAG: hypothetical protein HRT61_01165 [Ekhidna sp.]|nr:hypothetical protein [Ekhidna sp.]
MILEIEELLLQMTLPEEHPLKLFWTRDETQLILTLSDSEDTVSSTHIFYNNTELPPVEIMKQLDIGLGNMESSLYENYFANS